MENRLRLAPSPTGLLHIGTARTALFNWLFAKKTNGKFLLRIEDTDSNRSKEEFTENILEGLKWLGLDWDEQPIRQSKRIGFHKLAIKELLKKGAAYRCFATEEEIKTLRNEQKQNGEAPKHDNRHRNLSEEEIKRFISEGRSSVIRFKIEEDLIIEWKDLIRGEIKWQGKDLGGDMVLSRRAFGYEIGEPLYNLAVVVDDQFMNITHVVRGEDHISNTAKQILIYKSLDFDLPIFSHTPLILNEDGKKLSKRDSVTSIDDFKTMGYLPEALSNYMALLGWAPKSGEEEINSLHSISEKFQLENVNKSGAKFNWEKLNWINSQYIKMMPENDLLKIFRGYWEQEGWKEYSESWGLKLTSLLQDSVILTKDVIEQSQSFFETPVIKEDVIEFLKTNKVKPALESIYKNLESNNQKININTAKEIINNITNDHRIKKGILMRSLRASFFGCLNGPDLIQSWELLAINGQDIIRIKKCIEII